MNKIIMLFLASLVIILGLQAGVDAQREKNNKSTSCMANSQCRSSQACVKRRCVSPCKDACGTDATCTVRNHVAACTCPDDYTGDAFTACTPL